MRLTNGYVLQNVGTGSFVSHTEASLVLGKSVCLVWDNERAARDHARSLEVEYATNRVHLRPIDRMWRVRQATPEQLREAFAAGAYGPDYVSIIRSHTEQFRSREPLEEAEAFKRELDQ